MNLGADSVQHRVHHSVNRRVTHVGLMSGTSADGVDAALVEIDQASGVVRLQKCLKHPFSAPLKERIEAAISGDSYRLDDALTLNTELGHCFADAVVALLDGQHADAIGSHGQTVLHRPDQHDTLQLGSGAVIAERTGITTVTDFRSRDMVLGGEGAPLAPAFHHAAFHRRDENRTICNIGGISNLTGLPGDPQAAVTGFDTGPGNTLMDGWCQRHLQSDYDVDGQWARSGRVAGDLLERLLNEPYIDLVPPKSTGRELFNQQWLDRQLADLNSKPEIRPEDVQATLVEFTAQTICDATRTHLPETDGVFVCGGGAHNKYLLERLDRLLDVSVTTTQELGIEPDWVEAIAFAWLSWRTLNSKSGNLPEVTGASRSTILGCIWPGHSTENQNQNG